MTRSTTDDLIDRLPDPQTIRRRLVRLATEANYLRSLLRLVERRPASSSWPSCARRHSKSSPRMKSEKRGPR
jgi:hypothetical protein